MAIPRPVSKSIINSAIWGIPITDQVNANTTDIAALKAPVPWITATMQNGWVNASGQPVQYRKISDIVYVRGRADGGTYAGWVTLFTLPAGYRPANQIMFISPAVLNANWTSAVYSVNTDGSVQLAASGLAYASVAPVCSLSITA